MNTAIGLSSKEAHERLIRYGHNTIQIKSTSVLKKFVQWFISPVSLMLIAAAGVSYLIKKIEDVWIIGSLFFLNFIIRIWHEHKADTSIAKLQDHLAVRTRTYRDGSCVSIDATILVPGDVIELHSGSIVPADIRVITSTNATVNESALTGESIPVTKQKGETLYSGSFLTTGLVTGEITATGAHTVFGTTIASLDKTRAVSTLEKEILSIARMISIASVVVIVLLTVIFLLGHQALSEIITLDLSLLIAGIPVALPTVMSLIISIGVLELSKKQVVVRRLASLEDLAHVDLLLSDKTGTLTQNHITVAHIVPFGSYTTTEVLRLAGSAVSTQQNDSLDAAILSAMHDHAVESYHQESVTPGDSERKRSTAIISYQDNRATVSLGAVQVIASLCVADKKIQDFFTENAHQGALQGYRVHALAIQTQGTQEHAMEPVGVLLLADAVREDAAQTITFMHEHGIAVKMVTGDNYEISTRIAEELGLTGSMLKRDVLQNNHQVEKIIEEHAGFCEVLPQDKLTLVSAARTHHVVAVTGDGINDLPALSAAHVGCAVNNAVDALKGTADIVLLTNGIAVIKDALIEARNIFMRLYNYSLYRISESFRVIVTIAVIGVLYQTYPLTPVHLIILAFLNDIPIVSLAFDRVVPPVTPARINKQERGVLSGLFGLAGTLNSIILFLIMVHVFHLPWEQIQTAFFLKLVISGHLLIYVAHTKERWFRFFPDKRVIYTISATQILATALTALGWLVAPIPWWLIGVIWVWSLLWMQISEYAKIITPHIVTKVPVLQPQRI